jgi:hypothetical protein
MCWISSWNRKNILNISQHICEYEECFSVGEGLFKNIPLYSFMKYIKNETKNKVQILLLESSVKNSVRLL